MTKTLFALALTAASLLATPAVAKDHSWPVGNDQYHVYYTGLNLNSAAGRAGLLAHVEEAATKLCANLIASERQPCIADTIARSSAGPKGAMLQLALTERGTVRLAAR